MKGYTLQPREFTDNIYPDPVHGLVEGTKLPYPYHCDPDGNVQRQDFWRGDPLRIIGFQADYEVQRVDLWWNQFVQAPQAAVGMFIVGENDSGGYATYGKTPVRDVEEFEMREDQSW